MYRFHLGISTDGRLRLINNNNRVGFLNQINRLGFTKFLIIIPIDKIQVILEGIYGNNHNLNFITGSKITDFFNVFTIINKGIIVYITVKPPKMVTGNIYGLLNTFFNGYAWYYNNKLSKAIGFIQFQ